MTANSRCFPDEAMCIVFADSLGWDRLQSFISQKVKGAFYLFEFIVVNKTCTFVRDKQLFICSCILCIAGKGFLSMYVSIITESNFYGERLGMLLLHISHYSTVLFKELELEGM